MKRILVALGLGIFSIFPACAQSNESQISEVSGNWVALRHTPDGGITSDVCVAASDDGKMAFRADANSIEFRSTDKKWNMSIGQSGDVTVSAGGVSKTFSMVASDNVTLDVAISADDAKALFAGFDSASVATIRYGEKTTKKVSLLGSTKVINAFKSCAMNAGFADLGGASGSQSSPF